MSSFVRTAQKQMLKRMGYHRQKLRMINRNGVVMAQRLKKGEGPILDGDGVSVGRRWPLCRPSNES